MRQILTPRPTSSASFAALSALRASSLSVSRRATVSLMCLAWVLTPSSTLRIELLVFCSPSFRTCPRYHGTKQQHCCIYWPSQNYKTATAASLTSSPKPKVLSIETARNQHGFQSCVHLHRGKLLCQKQQTKQYTACCTDLFQTFLKLLELFCPKLLLLLQAFPQPLELQICFLLC